MAKVDENIYEVPMTSNSVELSVIPLPEVIHVKAFGTVDVLVLEVISGHVMAVGDLYISLARVSMAKI